MYKFLALITLNLIVIQFYKYHPSSFSSYYVTYTAVNSTLSNLSPATRTMITMINLRNEESNLSEFIFIKFSDSKKEKFKIQSHFHFHPLGLGQITNYTVKRHVQKGRANLKLSRSGKPVDIKVWQTRYLQFSSSPNLPSGHYSIILSALVHDPPRNISNGIRRKGG